MSEPWLRQSEEIDAKLLAGLASGDPIEVNDAFWAEWRRTLEMRLQKRKSAEGQDSNLDQSEMRSRPDS